MLDYKRDIDVKIHCFVKINPKTNVQSIISLQMRESEVIAII